MTVVLDAGALLAVERRDRRVLGLLRAAEENGEPLTTSAAVIAQVWRGGPRQAPVARALVSVRAQALTPDIGRQLGVLLGRSGTSDVVDAHVVWLAEDHDVLLTSDPNDLTRLLDARGVVAEIRTV